MFFFLYFIFLSFLLYLLEFASLHLISPSSSSASSLASFSFHETSTSFFNYLYTIIYLFRTALIQDWFLPLLFLFFVIVFHIYSNFLLLFYVLLLFILLHFRLYFISCWTLHQILLLPLFSLLQSFLSSRFFLTLFLSLAFPPFPISTLSFFLLQVFISHFFLIFFIFLIFF